MPVEDYLIVTAIGSLVGVGELVARYRDAPARALWNWSAALYITLNAVAGVTALFLFQTFGWSFGVKAGPQLDATRVIIAGFGAMAFLRSSIFVVRVGERDVGVGPSGFLDVALTAADRSVDRRRAGARAREVSRAMSSVSFGRAFEALPTYCLALMQNASEEEKAALAHQVKLLRDSSMEERAKTLALGLALMNVVGLGVLVAAIESLGRDITSPDR